MFDGLEVIPLLGIWACGFFLCYLVNDLAKAIREHATQTSASRADQEVIEAKIGEIASILAITQKEVSDKNKDLSRGLTYLEDRQNDLGKALGFVRMEDSYSRKWVKISKPKKEKPKKEKKK